MRRHCSRYMMAPNLILYLCFQVKEEKIGGVVRMRMNLRKGSWCLKRMDKVCCNTLPYNKHSAFTWTAFSLSFVEKPSSSRICSGHQDVGKWEIGGHVFWWSQTALSHPRKAPEKGALYSFGLNVDSAFSSLCEWAWLGWF